MFRCAMLVVSMSLLIPVFALAYVDAVYFQDSIMEGEDLAVLVEGSMPDSCWEFIDGTTNAYDQMLVVYIDTINPTPGDGCLTIVIPYEVDVVFPSLSVGTYTLRIYENRPPMEPNILDYTVEVDSPVGNGALAWGALKALYH